MDGAVLQVFDVMSQIECKRDSTSVQASSEGIGNVGVGESTGKRIRVYDGGDDLQFSVILAWFPMVYDFQTRLLFKQDNPQFQKFYDEHVLIGQGYSPEWNETFEFSVTGETGELVIRIKDSNVVLRMMLWER